MVTLEELSIPENQRILRTSYINLVEDEQRILRTSYINPFTSIIESNSSYGSKEKEIKKNDYIQLDKNSKLDKITKGYMPNNYNIISNYDLEEILETNTRVTDILRTNYYVPLERLKITPRDSAYFETSAKMILGIEAEPEKITRLREALMQFQESTTDTQFGIGYLPKFLKQNWVVSNKPLQNRLRNLSALILGKIRWDQPKEQNPIQGEPLKALAEKELEKYGLRLDIQQNGSHYGKEFRTKYFDTPFNFCLTYEGNLIASVGFIPDEGRIFIEQIQGIKGNAERLSPFKWERALVNYAVEWAQRQGIAQVSITSVDNNKWAQRHGHLNREQGKMIYDVTAKRSGFKREDDGNYSIYFEKNKENIVPQPEVKQEVF